MGAKPTTAPEATMPDLDQATPAEVLARLERTRREAREGEERFALAVRGANDGLWDWDLRTGQLYYSPRWKEQLGYADDEVPPTYEAWERLVHPDDLPRALATIRAYLAGETPAYHLEHRLLHKDGDYRWIMARGALARDAAGQPVRMAGWHTDITDQKRAEEAARASEALTAAIVASALDCVVSMDVAGRITEFNPAAERAFGHRREDVLGRDLAETLIPPGLREAHDLGLADYLATGDGRMLNHRVEVPALRADGTEFPAELAIAAIRVGGEPAFIGYLRDITARRQAEDEARARARQQAAVADLGQRALALAGSGLEVQPLLADASALVATTLAVEFVSVMELLPSGDRLVGRAGFGWPPEELGGAGIAVGTASQTGYGLLTGAPVVLAPDLTSETRFAVAPVLRRHGIASGATVVVHGGEGRPYGSLAVHSREHRTFTADDVNFLQSVANVLGAALARARADAQVREREAEYRAIFEAVTDGLTIVDPETRLVVEVNPALARMHGYEREEMVGRHPAGWIHPDYHALREDSVGQAINGGDFLTRAVDVRKDGSTFPVEVRGAGFTYRGRPHLLAVARDVTEQERAYALLEHRVAALARIAATLTFDQPIEATLEELAADVVGASGSVACAVGLVGEDEESFRLVGSHGLPPEFPGAVRDLWRAGANLPSVQAVRSGRPVVMSGFRAKALADPRYAPVHHLLHLAEWDIIVTVPLVFRRRKVGTLATYYLPDRSPSEEEIAFLSAIADQAAVAVENARLLAAAQDKAVLEERQRIARELHDSVSHALFDIGLGARTARGWLERDPVKAAGPLDYVMEMAEAGLAEMRSLLLELRPETLERDGLVAALERQATALRRRHGLQVVADLGAEPDLDPPVKEAVYRIAREALHNTVKHARAGRVALRLGEDAAHVELEVRDDGAGFDPAGSYPGHLGLRNMRERAERQGGTLEVASAPGDGTRVRVRLPRQPAG